MNFPISIYLIQFITIIFCEFISAQNPNLRFKHIDIEQGLSQNMIKDILQDSKGFIWIATWDGLNRFDGYNFKVYKHIDGDSTSLRINKISCLSEDKEGRLWIGTFGGGLSLFNREDETFTNYIHNPEISSSISSDLINSIFEDNQKRIWIGTRTGLSLIEKNTAFKSNKKINFINFKFDPQNPDIINNSVFDVFEDKSGVIWLSTYEGALIKLLPDKKGYEFISYYSESKISPSNLIDFIIEDNIHSGLFWINDYYKGIVWFDSKSGKFLYQYPYSDFSKSIPLENVMSILLDSDGEYWLGTHALGIYVFNPNKNSALEKIDHLNIDPLDPLGIYAPNITNFYEDKSGLIWIGTNTNGLYIHNKDTKKFFSFHNNAFDQNSLISDNVLSVLEDKDGNVWIGTELGLDKYNPVTKKFNHFNNDNEVNGTSSNIVYSLLQDTQGTIWIGTSDGLDKYNPLTNSFTHYRHNPKDPSSISNGEIIKIFSDSKGNLWFGSWNGGLNKLISTPNEKKPKFLHYKFDKDYPGSISDNRIMSIAESSDGQLWIGTADGGLNMLISDYRFNKDGSIIQPKFKSYKHNPKDPNSISGNDVRTILIDAKGILWLGTFGGGLNKFIPPKNDNDTAKFIHYRQRDGLPNDIVRGILQDDSGKLWIGTAYGLSRFNPDDNTFLNFDQSDGLKTIKFEDVSFRSKKNGKIYFGGIGGINVFDPKDIKGNFFKPEILITSLKRYNEDTGEMVEEKGISEKEKLILSYQNNILNFEFSALNYYSTGKSNYAYKLEGYNNNWIILGNKRDVTLTNLKPGEYTLIVKSSGNDGTWNENSKPFIIIITPPWWRTNWAYAFYGFLILLGIFATDRIMRRKVIRKERDKAKLREAELLKQQADELETVDRLVRIINNAEDLDNLFNSLLKQTMNFIPQAEMAAVFLLDKKDNLFKVAFTAGYKLNELDKISFTAEELAKRYTLNSDEVEKGIYIINSPGRLFGDEKLSEIRKPKSMLIMAVERDSTTEAYVVFDSFSDEKPFDRSAARLLNRFREHAISAISKAQSIKILRDKNDEIVRTQEQLVTQQKLASLGALTAGIAHEIKNPLNFVNNFSEVSRELLDEMKIELQNNNTEDVIELLENLKQNLEKINQHGKRADSIVKGMLLHSRGNSGEKALVDVNELVDQDINLAYHGLRAQDKDFNITIEKDYDRSIEKINFVPQDISRVILNLVNNACYAANQKKRKSGNDFSPILKVSTKNLQGKVEIRIRDNGCGIPQPTRKNIFNPFFTTKPAGEGTGLGLSISYDIIVKQHKGELRFESEEGKFTEFIIILPKNEN